MANGRKVIQSLTGIGKKEWLEVRKCVKQWERDILCELNSSESDSTKNGKISKPFKVSLPYQMFWFHCLPMPRRTDKELASDFVINQSLCHNTVISWKQYDLKNNENPEKQRKRRKELEKLKKNRWNFSSAILIFLGHTCNLFGHRVLFLFFNF